jgi:Rha family phage regulatory protein
MSDSFEKFILLSGDEPVTTSKFVAEAFGKRHDNVLQKIEEILTQVPDFFGKLNFKETKELWTNNLGFQVSSKSFELTKDGFMLLVMGFTGAKAMSVKVGYIAAFNHLLEQNRRLAAQTPTIPYLPNLSDDPDAKEQYLRLSDAYPPFRRILFCGQSLYKIYIFGILRLLPNVKRFMSHPKAAAFYACYKRINLWFYSTGQVCTVQISVK